MENSDEFKSQWLYLLLMAICVGITLWGHLISTNEVSNTYEIAGCAATPAIIIWYVFYKVSRVWLTRTVQCCAFISIYVSLINGFLAGYARQSKDELKSYCFMQTEILRLLHETNATDLINFRLKDEYTVEKGDWRKLQIICKDCVDAAIEECKDYEARLKSAGWNDLFDSERLKMDADLGDSIEIIEKTKKIIEEHQALNDKTINNLIGKIHTLQFSDEQSAIAGFNSGIKKSLLYRDKAIKLDSEIISLSERAISILAVDSEWTVSDGQILFFNERSCEKYNDLHNQIQEAAKNQNALIKKFFEDKLGSVKHKIKEL